MGSDRKEVLLIFIKNPEAGKVKTRLAETLGDREACRVYRKLLALTRTVSSGVECRRQLWYSRYIDGDDPWDPASYDKRLQQGDDLGERMKYAFEQAFASGFERAVVIGSDCAELEQNHIKDAFRALENRDIVIGPSKDGGYYLLGMNAPHPRLFEEISWSTASVFEDTMSRIRELDLSCEILPVLNDIDTEEDLRNAAQRLQGV